MPDDTPRTAVNQSPGGGTDYPCARENDLAGRVLDLYLTYRDPTCSFIYPFYLTVTGDTFTVSDSTAAVIATGDSGAAVTTAWGTRTIYEWITTTTILRVVVREDLLVDGMTELDPRTYNRCAPQVNSLAVSTDMTAGRRKQGDLALANGYNTALTYAQPTLTDGGRFTQQVTIAVTPGGGLGLAPGCAETSAQVRSVNNAPPDASGNVLISPGDGQDSGQCFRIQLPAVITSLHPRVAAFPTTAAAHSISIESDCAPCCTCDYFLRTYEGLRRMVGKWQAMADAASSVRDTYENNRDRWLAQRTCRMDNPLTLTALPLKSCYLSVATTFCNMSGTCLPPIEIRVTVGVDGEEPATFCGPAYINGSQTNGDAKYTPGLSATVPGGAPVFVATFPYTNPQDQAHFRARLVVTGCGEGLPIQITATVHIPDTAGAELPAAIDDGSPWGSSMPTRAKESIWVAAIAAPPSFCCEGD